MQCATTLQLPLLSAGMLLAADCATLSMQLLLEVDDHLWQDICPATHTPHSCQHMSKATILQRMIFCLNVA